MTTHDPIPARLAVLKTTPELKKQWRDLFGSEPPPFNRRYLESRLAYRIQELAYGGLKPETIRRLEKLGEELDSGGRPKSPPTSVTLKSSTSPRNAHTLNSACPSRFTPSYTWPTRLPCWLCQPHRLGPGLVPGPKSGVLASGPPFRSRRGAPSGTAGHGDAGSFSDARRNRKAG